MAIEASLLTVQTESEMQRGPAPMVAAPQYTPVQPPSQGEGRGAGRGHGRGVARSAMQQQHAAEEPRASGPPPLDPPPASPNAPMVSSRREAILEAVRVALDEPALRAVLLDISSVCSHMEECPEMYAVEQVEEVAAERESARRRLQALREQRGMTSAASQDPHAATKPPEAFLCPISFELMDDPVVASDGHSYQRFAIEAWLEKNDTSPKTNMAMDKRLIPNYSFRSLIDIWKDVQARTSARTDAAPPPAAFGSSDVSSALAQLPSADAATATAATPTATTATAATPTAATPAAAAPDVATPAAATSAANPATAPPAAATAAAGAPCRVQSARGRRGGRGGEVEKVEKRCRPVSRDRIPHGLKR